MSEETLQQTPVAEDAPPAPAGETPVEKPSKGVTVTTRISLDTRAALSRRMLLGSWLFTAILIGAFVLIGVLLLVFLDEESRIPVGVTVIVAGAVIPPLMFGATLLLARLNMRKSPGAKTEKTVTLTFSDKITGVETADEKVIPIEYEYGIIRKILETKDYWFLIVDSGAAIAVSKTGFTNGTPEELRGILSEKVKK